MEKRLTRSATRALLASSLSERDPSTSSQILGLRVVKEMSSEEGGSEIEEDGASRKQWKKRQQELKLTKFPVLESLDPTDVNRFLLRIEAFEQHLKMMFKLETCLLPRYISMDVDVELNELGEDTTDREKSPVRLTMRGFANWLRLLER